MWVTISRTEKKRTRRGASLRFKIAATFLLFTALLLLILNVYPVRVSRDMVFSTKKSAMQSQNQVIASSLSALDTLSGEAVSQVMELLDVTPMTRMIVTDGNGLILYDTSDEDNAVGRYALLSEAAEALNGRSAFYCGYTGGVFVTRSAMPVISGSGLLGAVYLYEYDAEQGEIILGLQRNLRNMSSMFGAAGVIIVYLIAATLTNRIKRLANAVGVVSSGDYAYRVDVKGRDEIAQLSSEFNVLTGRLESTEEVRRRFVSDASHELRTPLAAIRLLSDSIAQSDGMDPDTMREFAADIGSESERLQRITEKLMSLTKLDAGVSRTQREPADMKAAAERTLHLLEPLAAMQDVRLVTDLEEGCVVLAASDDLYQIIFNLAENGIKYNVPGGSVEISLRKDRASAVLTVSDTGIGIPEEDLDSIFDRFYRVDKARSRASGGSGLGLAIVHDAVTANDGEIRVEAREGGGTVFTVIFPLVRGRKGRRT